MVDPYAQDLPRSPVTGGASLIIAWQLKDKRVLIVGGGEVASQRIESVLVADPGLVTVITPVRGLHARTKRLIDMHSECVIHYDRRFSGPAELHRMDLVLTALDDKNRSREIVEMCRTAKIPVNAADIPELCDFYFGAMIRDGPLQIMVSTNGSGPRYAGLFRDKLRQMLEGNEGQALNHVALLRKKLRERTAEDSNGIGRKRMKWMSQLCEQWSLDDFCSLTEPTLTRLLDEGWDQGRVPSPEEIVRQRKCSRKFNILESANSPVAKFEPAPESEHTSTPIMPIIVGFVAGVICTAMTGFTFIRRK
jgi:precorrin-2 dehydrogenase / sirohydrochlorin ferrochelatase